ncbi:MAG: DUF2167 domain-containing protein [Thermodesulfovibrionales bacterium]
MVKYIGILLCAVLLAAPAAWAVEPPYQEMTAEEFEASLEYRTGEVHLPGGVATLRLTGDFRYLDPENTERLLVEGWGNPGGFRTLGMLVPADTSPLAENGWGVVITYEQDGHVSDKDADSIDYNELLAAMKKSVARENEARRKEGYETLEIIGWAARPYYDKASHKLYWAKELSFGGGTDHTLNYNVRILGRRGVLVLNAVAGMDQLKDMEAAMGQVIAFTDFNPGYRYSDFNAKTDKTATYGIAALVAGGVAAKAGLFTKLLGVLVAAKKLLVVAVVGIAAFFGRMFRKKKAGRQYS